MALDIAFNGSKSNFVCVCVFVFPAQSITMTYLPTYAVSLGIERSKAAYLISIIGIANVLGRPVAGKKAVHHQVLSIH